MFRTSEEKKNYQMIKYVGNLMRFEQLLAKRLNMERSPKRLEFPHQMSFLKVIS